MDRNRDFLTHWHRQPCSLKLSGTVSTGVTSEFHYHFVGQFSLLLSRDKWHLTPATQNKFIFHFSVHFSLITYFLLLIFLFLYLLVLNIRSYISYMRSGNNLAKCGDKSVAEGWQVTWQKLVCGVILFLVCIYLYFGLYPDQSVPVEYVCRRCRFNLCQFLTRLQKGVH